MKIESDNGNLYEIPNEHWMLCCEEGWKTYLKILKTCGCELDEETIKKRKERWFSSWKKDLDKVNSHEALDED